jgi:diguanylate cyclase (GGDEF)-like protein
MLALTGSIAILSIGGPDERYLLYPNVVIAFFLATPVIALTLCSLSLAAASYILLPALEIFEYSKFLLSISGCILFAYIFARERNIQRDNLLNLSTRDALTGAGNRRAFDDRLQETVRMQQRTPGDSSMMLIDLDNFKQINDTEGHAIGDEVLILVADIVHGRLRAGDSLYRYGGDEFVVLAATEVTSAMKLAEELRYLVEAAAPPGEIAPTLSIGVAQHLPDEPGSDWVKRADDALFEAKRAGRNRVEIGTSVRLAG